LDLRKLLKSVLFNGDLSGSGRSSTNECILELALYKCQLTITITQIHYNCDCMVVLPRHMKSR